MTEEQLMEALRSRASDPAIRVGQPATVLQVQMGEDISGALSLGHELRENLGQLIAGGPVSVNRAALSGADALLGDAQNPAAQGLPPPAHAAALDTAERELGRPLPSLLRSIYTEIANGGLGPGSGLVGVSGGWAPNGSTLVEEYEQAVDGPFEEWAWPPNLLPIADLSDGVFLDTSRPGCPVLEWDAGDLDWDAEAPQTPDLKEVAVTFAAWLEEWLES